MTKTLHPLGGAASFLGRLSPETRERVTKLAGGELVDAPIAVAVAALAPVRLPEIIERPKVNRRVRRRRETRSERRQRQRERDEVHDRKREDRKIGELRARGVHVEAGAPKWCPIRIVRMARLCMADNTGENIEWYRRRGRNPVLMGALEEASLARAPGRRRRTWADRRARRTATLALIVDALATYNKRHGRFGGVMLGFPQSFVASLLEDPFERVRPHRNTIYGRKHKGGTAARGSAGYYHAFAELGVMYKQRLPADQAYPCELFGDSGYATGRLWIPTLAVERIGNGDARMQWFAFADVFAAMVGPPQAYAV